MLTRILTVVAALSMFAAALAQRGPTHEELLGAAQNSRDWLYVGHDYLGQRFVELDQINAGNADELVPICSFHPGEVGAFQSKALVYEGVIYFTTLDSTYAIDATTCEERWRHTWEPRDEAFGISHRGAAIADGLVVRGTRDGYLIALDMLTGQLVWDRQVREQAPEYFNMPPLIYGDVVIIAPALAPKGWIAAFDIDTGERLWKFNVVPDPDEPGAETWAHPELLGAGDFGGGTVWSLYLDPEAERLYAATGEAKPDILHEPGDNLYLASMVVLDVNTGELLWHFQLQPGGAYGSDAVQAGPLYTAEVDGVRRQLVATGGKRGVLHVLDRETQEVIFETPMATMKDAGLPYEPDFHFREEIAGQRFHVCPGDHGVIMWSGPAFSPETNLLYVPAVDWCSTWTAGVEGAREIDPVDKGTGWLNAVDGSTGHIVWRYASSRPMLGEVAVTSGNVVFTGELTGDFLVLNARSGQVLYRYDTGGSIAGGVSTYELDDRQYVAVLSGNNSPRWSSHGSVAVTIFSLP